MADYGNLAAKLLQKHFVKFGSFRSTCSYNSVANSVYTPSTGNVAPASSGVQPGVEIIFADFTFTQTQAGTTRDDEEEILKIDKQAIFPALDLDYTPKVGDLITDDTGLIWKVKAIGDDPKPAHYALHVRPASHA